MEQAITNLYFAIGIMMVIFATLQFTGRQKTRVSYRLGILFFSLGYIWLYYGLYRANRLVWAPWLLYSDVFVTFLVGPFLYAYSSELAGVTPCRPVPRLLPYLPALAFLIYMIISKPAAGVSGTALPGPDPDHFAIPVVGILNLLADLFFFCYVFASTRNIVRIFRAGDRPLRKAFRGVVIYFVTSLGTFIVFFAGHALRSDNLLGLAVLANGINSAYFFFLSYRYPEYTQKPVRVPGNGGKAVFSLRGIDVPNLLNDLREAMETNREYRDPDITLQSLSSLLGIQYHQLSHILNHHLGTSFRRHINQYRVDEAKRLLAEDPGLSVLEVAFTVGFNSKSAFNSVFVRSTGLSPSEFRKKISPNVQVS